MSNKIDFVIPWVDGSNPDWKKRFEKFADIKEGDSRNIRYRDWDLLRFWFRSIEKFTPWVNNVYFITSGELPEWINLKNSKLHWIRHEEFISEEYLPTFSVRTIEMNLHLIQGLSEQFVYFNDDFFITKPVAKSRFFRNDLPCDYAVMTAKPSSGGTIHAAINDLEIIGKHFNKHEVLKKHFPKWFSLKYKKGLINNILLYPWKEFSGFIDPHIPYSFLKSTLSKIWKAEPEILDSTCKSKFRTNNDVNQWLIRYWQLAEGKFHPYNTKDGSLCIDINDDTIGQICDSIRKQNYDMICINDSTEISDFEKCKTQIQESLSSILPEKSSFEK